MLKDVKVRLTIFYSALFLVLFWTFGAIIYLWMDYSFGENYVADVEFYQDEAAEQEFYTLTNQNVEIVNIAGKVAIRNLGTTLLVLNGLLLFIIPFIAWILTRRTLGPVQQVHEQQKQFVSDVSHELRTPLFIMNGELEVSLNKDRTEEEYRQVITSTKQETEHLIDLTENLLFLARFDMDRLDNQVERLELIDLLAGVIAGLTNESTKKDIKIQFTPEDEPVYVTGNAVLLKRVFFNIVHNAINYSHEHDDVRIKLRKLWNHAYVRISDTGPGISKEDQQKIFDRFYRVDSSRSETRGYGLGLAISKSIIEMHDGKISVTSSPGKGSTFTISLPVLND